MIANTVFIIYSMEQQTSCDYFAGHICEIRMGWHNIVQFNIKGLIVVSHPSSFQYLSI